MVEPAASKPSSLADLDRRSREVFRAIVETYLSTGEPVGSRTVSKRDGFALSPASIRNTMQDLTELGLLSAPHVSAGRTPTHIGLRLFVDGLLEVGDVTEEERAGIEAQLAGSATSVDNALERASEVLSGLAGGAGIVTTPKREAVFRHVEFVALGPGEALCVLVFVDGAVENRIIRPPAGLPPAALVEAGNYLSSRLKGRTLAEARSDVLAELEAGRAALDVAATGLVAAGLADWSGGAQRSLIVRGRARLLDDAKAAADLERIRQLFEDLEKKEGLIALLDETGASPAVKIYIGAENPLFSLSGSSLIAAPYKTRQQRLVGAVGVIGPTRLNYARVIPLVDYTARVVSRLLDEAGIATGGKP